jgi:HYDIN/CFA65/VesB family protein/Ig-like domain-containing protein/centrosomal CEP192-like protein/immunoglobulin I-set domain protein
MHTTGKISEKIQSAAILFALVFAFGATAHANVTPSPATINFGNQAVGTTSTATEVTLTNNSRRSTTIVSVSSSSAQFSYFGPTLPVTLNRGQSLTASVTFNPAAAQSYAGTLTFTRGNGSTVAIVLSGIGSQKSTNYTISAAPSSFSFSFKVGGAVPSSQSVTIDDTTPGPLPFRLSADQPWIVLSAASGTTKAVMQFGVNPSGLAAGNYSGHVFVTASGVANSPLTVPVTLAVSSASSVAPAITTQPSSRTVTAGQAATFTVAATGTAPMTYQWKKNASAINGAMSSSYTTPATTTSDNTSQFTVVVTNSAGNATSTAATLTVNTAAVAPTITTQPGSKTVTAGQTATFIVAATGTAPMTYQWKKNGTSMSGATSSSYTTPATTTSDNASQFTVVVNNSAGSATSTAAILTINAATLALNASSTALSFGNVTLSTGSSQNVTLTNAGNSNITISNVSVSGAGFSATGVSTGLILTPGQTAALKATFTPAATGSLTGSVSVTSNATNSPDTIALSGTGLAQANHSVSLSWSPSTSTVIGYNSYSSTISGGPYTKLNTTRVPATTYTDTTVQAGLTYYYVVTAVDSNNVESAFSTEVSANIP